MPSAQRRRPKGHGGTFKRGKAWQARYRDENGRQRGKSGFPTQKEAADWVLDRLNEVAALRRGDLIPASHRPKTVAALLDMFEQRHGATVDPATLRKLKSQLKHARGAFGDRQPDSLNRLELEDWRSTLSPGARHDVFRAFRQALTWAHLRNLTTRDATRGIRNPKRKRHERAEIHPFESWDDVRAVADELDARYRAVPIVGVGCGLRPEELFGLHRADVDRSAGVLHVRRRFSGGELKDGGKTAGSVRTVPLRQVVLDALEAMPPRIDTPVLFPAPRGGYIDIERA